MTVWKCLRNLVAMKTLLFYSVFGLFLIIDGKVDRPRGVPISST